MAREILDYFPLNEHILKPMPSQVSVIQAVKKAFDDGYKNVLLEAPVGSGKSAIAVTFAKYYGQSHILTPRKSLQDQYLDDFGMEEIVVMKGRGAYPCKYKLPHKQVQEIEQTISSGKLYPLKVGALTCAEGPCKQDDRVYNDCTKYDPCPYAIAIDTAQKSPGVIHNLHSFIFQASFAGRFDTRDIIIIDECHEIEGIVRDFAEINITIQGKITEDVIPRDTLKTLKDWAKWFQRFEMWYTAREVVAGLNDKQRFHLELLRIESMDEIFGDQFTIEVIDDPQKKGTKFRFIPVRVDHLIKKYLLDYGDKRLLMSGTIYNKTAFCNINGLKEDETCFMRIGSTFPVNTRPIVLKDAYTVDTSHKKWNENFDEMIEKVRNIMNIFKDVKGLIHTPSYLASQALYSALVDTNRIIAHGPQDFQQTLAKFYEDEDPVVFLSPVCQQGVDFKYDRARFQIVLRVPYLNTSDPFVSYQVKKNFPWYNHQALVTFGQQIGRINRAPDDYGATFLVDSRFKHFIAKNSRSLPKWLTDSIVRV